VLSTQPFRHWTVLCLKGWAVPCNKFQRHNDIVTVAALRLSLA